jgi:NAD dependent epimerase/dehydratase family
MMRTSSPTLPVRRRRISSDDGIYRSGRTTSGSPTAAASSWISRQTLIVLLMGVFMGYIFLPVLLLEMQVDEIMGRLPELKQPLRDSTPHLRPVDPEPPRTLLSDKVELDQTDVEKRLMEERDIMSKQSMPTATTPYVMRTPSLPDHHRKKILVTGGAGFVGSHLVDKLMMEGHEVIVVDNFFTGQKKNIAHWLHHPNFR